MDILEERYMNYAIPQQVNIGIPEQYSIRGK